MVGPIDIVAPGGRLIIASQCSEGIGSQELIEAQQRLVELGPDDFLQNILTKSHAAPDEWQTQMQLKAMAIGRIQLHSPGLNESQHALTGVERIESVRDAVLDSVAASGDAAVAVIPEGPYVVPVLSNVSRAHPLWSDRRSRRRRAHCRGVGCVAWLAVRAFAALELAGPIVRADKE